METHVENLILCSRSIKVSKVNRINRFLVNHVFQMSITLFNKKIYFLFSESSIIMSFD